MKTIKVNSAARIDSVSHDHRSEPIRKAIELLREAEQPGISDDKVMKARILAYETDIPQVQLAALHSINRVIKMQAWLNLNLEEPVIKFLMGKMEGADEEIRDLAARAMKYHIYAVEAQARLTEDERRRIREKAQKHHNHDLEAKGIRVVDEGVGATAWVETKPDEPNQMPKIPTTLIAGTSTMPTGIDLRKV